MLATICMLCRATSVLRRLVSPIHFSTDERGQVHRGLDHVPVGDGKRPVLFVGNHQVHAALGWILCGLHAHPLICIGHTGAKLSAGLAQRCLGNRLTKVLQTLALDIGFIIEDILRAKGKLLRGLAHPAVFAVRPRLHCARDVSGSCFALWAP